MQICEREIQFKQRAYCHLKDNNINGLISLINYESREPPNQNICITKIKFYLFVKITQKLLMMLLKESLRKYHISFVEIPANWKAKQMKSIKSIPQK